MQREKIKSTQEQEPLWGRAAFIARVWIGLDSQPHLSHNCPRCFRNYAFDVIEKNGYFLAHILILLYIFATDRPWSQHISEWEPQLPWPM